MKNGKYLMYILMIIIFGVFVFEFEIVDAATTDCRCFTEAQGKLFETKLSQVGNEEECRQSCISNEANSFQFDTGSAKPIEEINNTGEPAVTENNTTNNNINNADYSSGSICPGGVCDFGNPFKSDDPKNILDNLLKALQGVVATIAIIIIVIGGMMFTLEGFSQQSAELAKKLIAGALIGLSLVVVAPTFIKEIMGILSPLGVDSSGAPSLKELAERLLVALMSSVGVLCIIGLILGAQTYMTAYGNEERMNTGKSIIKGSIIGILIAMASLIIVKQVAAWLI